MPKKNRNFGRFRSIYSHFSARFWDIQNQQFGVEPPNCVFRVYGRLGKGHSGSHQTQKCQRSSNSIRLSVIRPMNDFWIIWTPKIDVRLSLTRPQATCTLWYLCCNNNSVGPKCWKVSDLAEGVLGSQNTKNPKYPKNPQIPSWLALEWVLGVIEPFLADFDPLPKPFSQGRRGGGSYYVSFGENSFWHFWKLSRENGQIWHMSRSVCPL